MSVLHCQCSMMVFLLLIFLQLCNFFLSFPCALLQCHETRSLHDNRKLARQRLQERLDIHFNGENSFVELQKKEFARKKEDRKKRTRDRLMKLREFKEREGIK